MPALEGAARCREARQAQRRLGLPSQRLFALVHSVRGNAGEAPVRRSLRSGLAAYSTRKQTFMGAGHSLLTRVRRPEFAVARRAVSDAETRESILEHLRSMCMTRQGSMVTCPDFGVCDVNELMASFPDAIADMAQALKHSIQTYEPRLAGVRVKHVPSDDMTLRYEVTAQVILERGRLPIRFETSIDTSRRVSVR